MRLTQCIQSRSYLGLLTLLLLSGQVLTTACDRCKDEPYVERLQDKENIPFIRDTLIRLRIDYMESDTNTIAYSDTIELNTIDREYVLFEVDEIFCETLREGYHVWATDGDRFKLNYYQLAAAGGQREDGYDFYDHQQVSISIKEGDNFLFSSALNEYNSQASGTYQTHNGEFTMSRDSGLVQARNDSITITRIP